MEGCPINGFDIMSSYPNYNNNVTCSPESILQELGNANIGNTNVVPWLPMITMKEELINHMKDDVVTTLDEEEDNYFEDLSNRIITIIDKIKIQQTKMNEIEETMKQAIQENQKDIHVFTTFIEFLSKISNQTDKDMEPIQTQINSICEDIKYTSKMKEIKEQYILEKQRFHKYLNIIKLLNQMNVGSTCTICLQENVNSYFNPCGHTACSKCCEKNSNYNGSCCPLCRSVIHKINKLYFS
jgi:hypothetical protein